MKKIDKGRSRKRPTPPKPATARRGRPPKPPDEVKTVHFGMKVTELEYALLMGIVASENLRLAKDGYEPNATTASMIRKLIKLEAKSRNLIDDELRPVDPDVNADARAERAAWVPVPTSTPKKPKSTLQPAAVGQRQDATAEGEHPVKRARRRGGAGWPQGDES